MFRKFVTIKRKVGLTPEQFRAHYESSHATLVCELAGTPPEYRRHYIQHPPESEGGPIVDFDVMTEFVFNDREEFDRWIGKLYAPEAHERLAADEAQFIESGQLRIMTVETYETKSVGPR